MKLPGWLPHPAAWATAVALFFFAAGVSIAMALVLPALFELMPRSPRLAWLGILLLWLAPIAAAAGLHHAAHSVLDLGDTVPSRGTWPGVGSLWAGFVAWATILFVTLVTSLVMLVVDPPPVEPDAMRALGAAMTQGFSSVARAIIWIVLAAYVYQLERVARKGASAT
ncbi:MAG: hypothetical protein ABSE49_35005 [Polyangiaceae bacterium]